MSARKNIFLIGRKGHRGDENQLTEMLAWLFQQEGELVPAWLSTLALPVEGIGDWKIETQRAVPGGFVDIVVHSPGKSLVVLESKLGSTTNFEQISKYVEYLKSAPVSGPKALVFMTQHPEPWPAGATEAAGNDVTLIRRRWQALGEFLRASGSVLAGDFVAMMEKEGLVTPDAVTPDHWETWRRGNEVARRLTQMLIESAERIQRLEPGFQKGGAPTLANNGLLYRLFHFENVSCGLGFWPTRNPPRPDDHAMVVVYVLNTALGEVERKAAGLAAVEKAATPEIAMSGWSEYYVQHSTPAHEVLSADDFDAQVEQLVDHLRAVTERFRELSYLPAAEVGHTPLAR